MGVGPASFRDRNAATARTPRGSNILLLVARNSVGRSAHAPASDRHDTDGDRVANGMAGPDSEQGTDGRNSTRREGPTHPVWKANLLMAGVVILLLVLSVAGGR